MTQILTWIRNCEDRSTFVFELSAMTANGIRSLTEIHRDESGAVLNPGKELKQTFHRGRS